MWVTLHLFVVGLWQQCDKQSKFSAVREQNVIVLNNRSSTAVIAKAVISH